MGCNCVSACQCEHATRYDLDTQQLLYQVHWTRTLSQPLGVRSLSRPRQEPNANSVAWNTEMEDVRCSKSQRRSSLFTEVFRFLWDQRGVTSLRRRRSDLLIQTPRSPVCSPLRAAGCGLKSLFTRLGSVFRVSSALTQDMLAYSGSNMLCIKTGNFPPHMQKLQGAPPDRPCCEKHRVNRGREGHWVRGRAEGRRTGE